MSDEHDHAQEPRDRAVPSLEEIAEFDAFLDHLVSDRQPSDRAHTGEDAQERLLAAQVRLTREGVEEPTQTFLERLEQTVGHAVAREARRRRKPAVSRWQFLRTAATLAGGAGLGIAGVEGVAAARENGQPHELVEAGNERWYAVATEDEVLPGGIKSFTAGGVMGFLLNTNGSLHAVSAICTHMGCRLKPSGSPRAAQELRCLCHGSRFNSHGEVTAGLAPTALPSIAVRVENGMVYALGTRETV